MRVTNRISRFNASTDPQSTKPVVKRHSDPSRIESLEGRVLFSTNLLVNGNFSLGNVGFTSQYVSKAQRGGYVVGANPSINLGADHDKYASMGDHTTGKGLMLQADAATKANTFVWEETVKVVATENYVFTGYDASIGDAAGNNVDPSPARLAVYVNGISTGDIFTAPSKDAVWSQFSTDWVDVAGTTTAVIKIVDLNTTGEGNDFVLDDLSFKHSPSLINNGDFTKGDTGFTSQYGYKTKPEQPGDIVVGANPSKDLASDFASFGDHTTGTGLMLEVDGSTKANQAVWQENLVVTKGNDYIFSAWAASFGQTNGNHTDPEPAQLAIYVNGVKLGSTFSVAAKDGQWTRFSSIWDAKASGVVTIKIVDLNVKQLGNNFALDDLAFEQL
jgi:hypothetical protein